MLLDSKAHLPRRGRPKKPLSHRSCCKSKRNFITWHARAPQPREENLEWLLQATFKEKKTAEAKGKSRSRLSTIVTGSFNDQLTIIGQCRGHKGIESTWESTRSSSARVGDLSGSWFPGEEGQ